MKKRFPAGRWRSERGVSRKLLILGADARALDLARAQTLREERRLEIVGHVRLEGESVESSLAGEVFEIADLEGLLRSGRVDEVVARSADCGPAIQACTALEIPLTIVSELPGDVAPGGRAEPGAGPEDSGTPLAFPIRLLLKRGLDVTFAAGGLLVASPVLVLSALAIQVSSPGAIVSRQARCGLDGRKFTLYRLRTERAGASSRPGQRGAVGRLVHEVGIDDLPQLWNVLKGDMSVVGPRPLLPSELARRSSDGARRLAMRPGLTCLWQVSARPAPGPDECAKLDLQYVDGWSLRMDLKILAQTVPAVLRSVDG